MTDRPKDRIDEKTVSDWMHELPRAEADPAFRDRLASAFASGEIDVAASGPERSAGPQRAQLPWWRWIVPAVAAVSGLFIVMSLNRGPLLEVAEISGANQIVVAGRAVSSGTIDAGTTIEVPTDVTLDLIASDVALWEVTPGTRMTIPRLPGRWFGRESACSLFVGEMRLKTGAQFAGGTLRVYTPDGMVEVTGTLLSIQCDEGGTCVCVLEGVARVGVDESDLETVEPGLRKIMLRDGTKEIIPVKPMHRDGVLDFDARMGSRLEPPPAE